jgi:transcriptional regulator of aromatic amino acid metabolism
MVIYLLLTLIHLLLVQTCKDLLTMFPERYPDSRTLAKALGFHETKISEWISTYQA